MTAPATTTASKKYQPIITKYQPIQIRRCFEIQMKSLFKRPRHRCFPVKLLRTRLFIEHLQMTASGRAQDFTKNGPNGNS